MHLLLQSLKAFPTGENTPKTRANTSHYLLSGRRRKQRQERKRQRQVKQNNLLNENLRRFRCKSQQSPSSDL